MNPITMETVLRNPFWKPNIGHIVIVATVLFGWGRMSERFDTMLAKQVEDEKKLESIDKNGTNYSSNKLFFDQNLLTDHNERIRKIEDAVVNVAVLKEKIDRISDDVSDIKKRAK
jgi:hypothetical protein